MFVQQHTCCYLKGNTNLLNVIHVLQGRRQTFLLHSFPFPLSSHWVCPMPRHRPGALMGTFFHHGHCQSLESYVIAKRQYAVATCEILLQLNLGAGSPLLQLHMLEVAWKHRDNSCIDLIIYLCASSSFHRA